MYSWINQDGSVLQTDTIKQFCEISGFCPSSARTLAAGIRGRLRGWCSTAKRAKKQRDRFTLVLVHTPTGVRKFLGPSVKKFAKEHGLCLNELSRLINRRSRKYRGWILQRTLDAIDGNTADSILEENSTMPRLQSLDALVRL
jgi:hypothetical protein